MIDTPTDTDDAGGEPEDAGADHAVDPELLELFEVLEWDRAVAESEGRPAGAVQDET